MDALTGYIGLNEPGESGLSLVSLPGITLTNFAAIKTGKNDADTDLWNKIQDRALRKFATACMAKINACYQINDATVVSCLVNEKKALFATALWYLLGNETMIERIYSDRVNRWTTIDKPEAEELSAYYAAQFENELQYAINGLSPADSDCTEKCVECTGKISFTEVSL